MPFKFNLVENIKEKWIIDDVVMIGGKMIYVFIKNYYEFRCF